MSKVASSPSTPFRAAVALLADEVVFRSPVVFRPYVGRDTVAPIVHAVAEVFENLRYIREIGSDTACDHVLVFEARVGDRAIEGCDIIHTGAGGLIDELTVLVRPLTATLALAEAMRDRLAAVK